MNWVEVVVVVDDATLPEGDGASPSQRVVDVLDRFLPPNSIALEQIGDPVDWRADALLAETWIKGYAPDELDSAEWRASITAALAEARLPLPSFALLAEQDWQHAWRAHYRPIRVGERFWIRPSWDIGTPQQAGDLVITLDPGMAFGTGTHATTQLCLQALERLVQPQESVLDLGCGSGILSLGASMLGAHPVLAVDIDADAVEATRANAAANGVALAARQGSLPDVTGRWQIVVANILAPILSDMIASGRLLDRVAPDGYLVLSGILVGQAAAIEATLRDHGVRQIDVEQMGGWVALIAVVPQ